MAITFTKEHQFVCGYSDGILCGKFDFSTGKFYGKSGREVVNLPEIFRTSDVRHINPRTAPVYTFGYTYIQDNPLLCAVNLFFYAAKNLPMGEALNNYRCGLERVISVNYPIGNFYTVANIGAGKYDSIFNKKLFNYVQEQIQKSTDCRGSIYESLSDPNQAIHDLEKKEILNKIEQKYPLTVFTSIAGRNAADTAIADYVNQLIESKNHPEDKNTANAVNYYANKLNWIYSEVTIAEHESVFVDGRFYNSCFGASFLSDLYDMLEEIAKLNGEKVNIKSVRNLASEYFKAYHLLSIARARNADKMLAKNNNLQWLYYEDDRVVIKPLLSRAEFHDEAEQQHNCVERFFFESAKDGRTHIVSVRLKSDLSKSYITCEVNNRGGIVQFLCAFNKSPTKQEDLNLKIAYAEHLRFHHMDT